MHFAVPNLGTSWRVSEMQRQFPDHFVANEPSTRRTKGSTHGLDAKPLRQIVKSEWRVRKKPRAHAGTKPRLRMPDLLPPRAWLARRLAMKLQLFPATDELHISASFAKQSCQIQGGGSATDHDDVAAAERLDLVMASTMREKFRGQMRQILGNIIEVRDTHRQHNRAGLNGFTILELQPEPVPQSVDPGYQLVLQLRHHPIPKGKPISRECLKPHGNAGIGIFDPPLRAKLP